jgi:predicted metalloprotease with PDZ domain
MKLKLILAAALLAGSSLLSAQGAEEEAIDRAELQQQIEQARQDLAEAAQRMARLQRELVQGSIEGQAWVWSDEGLDQLALPLELDIEVSPDKVRRLVLLSHPPRLGTVLGDPDSDDRNRIIAVTPGSGAEQAGLRQGDRLIRINDTDVQEDTVNRIRQALAEHKPGDQVDVMVRRGEHEELVMAVSLGSPLYDFSRISERIGPMMHDIQQHIIRVGPDGIPPIPPIPPVPTGVAGLGHDTHLVNNHPGLERYFGTAEGVLVLRIAEDNPLELKSGDVILEVDGEAVKRPVDFGRLLLGREAGDTVTLTIMRDGGVRDLSGTIPERQSTGSTSRQIEIHRQRRAPDGA